eukprot:GEMP01007071.1.p1 GENE.GEMP01007071.1~~GEMP01007071.1.p1  ORF type:complete len:725 (+),score=139.85 GEMP01007071.1:25-2199(+)
MDVVSMEEVDHSVARVQEIVTQEQLLDQRGELSQIDVTCLWCDSKNDRSVLPKVYHYLEAVILAAHAEGFNVYDAAFEALVKIGGFIGIEATTPHLISLLERINEVYDVLLSCVETYEWVQPGATGLLRLWMLQTLFACVGHDRITGRQLMELTNNDVSGAVSLVSFVLRTTDCPFELQDAAGRCLVDLTTADSVFLDVSGDASPGSALADSPIEKLTLMLNRHVNHLIKSVIQFEVVDAFGRCICQHQQSHSHTDVIIKHFLTTIHNCLLYCSENQKKLRQHLSTQSSIVEDIMLPYVDNILPALLDNPNVSQDAVEWQNLKATLQCFVIVSFNINVFRPHFLNSDMILRILQVPHIMEYANMLELIFKLLINIDCSHSPHLDFIIPVLEDAVQYLSDQQRRKLRRRMNEEGSHAIPWSRSTVKAKEMLLFAFQDPADVPSPEPEPEGPVKKANTYMTYGVRKRNKRSRNRRGRKRWMPMQKRRAETDSESDDSGIDGEEEENMEGAGPDDGEQLGTCALTGQMMTEPMRTVDGNIIDRASLIDWLDFSNTDPITGTPLELGDCKPLDNLQEQIFKQQCQALSAAQLGQEVVFAKKTKENHAPVENLPLQGPPEPNADASLLGNLPDLPSTGSPKKAKGKIRIASRSIHDAPNEFRCSIDGKLMINPLKSPYGHYFERKTLERWILSCGSVCPITSKPLKLVECEPDSNLKKSIVRFLKGPDS